MRLFVAVTPPSSLLDLVEDLPRPALTGLRWTTRDQWHVTLRFLGEVERAEHVARALRLVPESLQHSQVREVEAVLGPAVAWFKGRRILQVPVSGVEQLAQIVSTATAKWGDPPDHFPYVGHLTLARVRGQGKGPESLAGTPIHGAWKVQELALISSTFGTGGARYEILETVPLGLREA